MRICGADGYLYEDFGIEAPDETLRVHTDGYSIKVYAKSGDELVLTSPQDRSKDNWRLSIPC